MVSSCPDPTVSPASKSRPDVLGLCRFSLLGRGDWLRFRDQSDAPSEEDIAAQAKILFAPSRMETRLATFEHVTLASLKAQTDPEFRILVAAADRMPDRYRDRLTALCSGVSQIDLRFLPPTSIVAAQTTAMADYGMALQDLLQFRIDDDDAVSRHFIQRCRMHAASLWQHPAFAISFCRHYFCVPHGAQRGVYDWVEPFLGVGLCVRHPQNSVFQFGHFRLPTRMVALTDPDFPNIVTHLGFNDTTPAEGDDLNHRGLRKGRPAKPGRLAKDLNDHFSFLTPEGRALCGLPLA